MRRNRTVSRPTAPRLALQPAALLVVGLLLAAAPALAEPNLEWIDVYDGGTAYVDEYTCLLVDPSGNLVVGGESYDGIGGSDKLIRLLHRQTHEALWTVRFPAFDGNDMALTDMVWDGYGNIVVAGFVRGCVG